MRFDRLRVTLGVVFMLLGLLSLFVAMSFAWAFAPVSMQFRAHHYETITGSVAVAAFLLAAIAFPPRRKLSHPHSESN